jgi:hypothetical protein
MRVEFSNDLEERILFEIGNKLKIRCIFQGGSSLFFDNFHDLDFVVLIDNLNEQAGNFPWGFKIKQFDWIDKRVDCFLWDTQEYLDKIAAGNVQHYVSIATFWVMEHPEYIHYGALPEGLQNIDWREVTKRIVTNKYHKSIRMVQSVFTDCQQQTAESLGKWFYWDWIAMCFLENDSISLTEEQLSIAQKGHDKALTDELYLRWRKAMIKIVENMPKSSSMNKKTLVQISEDYEEFEEYQPKTK